MWPKQEGHARYLMLSGDMQSRQSLIQIMPDRQSDARTGIQGEERTKATRAGETSSEWSMGTVAFPMSSSIISTREVRAAALSSFVAVESRHHIVTEMVLDGPVQPPFQQGDQSSILALIT